MKCISPRDLREDSHTLTQHVGLKGHNGADIFHEDEDREKFMKSIYAACEKYEVELLVCVLMTNHVHMILKGEIKQFKFVFESLGASFARWHNFKLRRLHFQQSREGWLGGAPAGLRMVEFQRPTLGL